MKISLAQNNYHIGNFTLNTNLIKDSIARAQDEKSDLVIFSELSVCGYPPRDFLEYDYFLQRCEESILEISSYCNNIAAVIGAPIRNKNAGKRLYNAALFIADSQVKSTVSKSLLPNYDVFDENRYFEAATQNSIVEYKDWKIALTVCEDLWDIGERKLYSSSSMNYLDGQNLDLIINISASPFSHAKRTQRIEVVKWNSKKYNAPLIYLNQVGAQTEYIFDGGSMVSDKEGKIVDELKYFEEDFKSYVFQKNSSDVVIPNSQATHSKKQNSEIQNLHSALILGIKDYFSKSGFQKAILGLSGGIDSAVVLALAAEALGKENVLAVLMPSKFSSDHSVSDAEQLVKNLGVKSEQLSIMTPYDSFLETLKPVFLNLEFNLAEENLQARIRGTMLMALSNKFGYILLNTSNKSEIAVGYGTLYGDMCGGISVLGDVYKTQVYSLAAFINRASEVIPTHTLNKAPSAELRPNQADTDSLPDYKILDSILNNYIEQSFIPQNLDKETVQKVIGLVNKSEYKRWQFAPILRVTNRSFGMGRRMPIVSEYEINKPVIQN